MPLILTFAGASDEINALRDELAGCNVEELVRSGKIVMDRGASHFAHLLGRGEHALR